MPKFTLFIIILLSAYLLCPEAYAVNEDIRLREYFSKAVSLFEDKEYRDAIKVLEHIIKIEEGKGQYYFIPFCEVYIQKSKAKIKKSLPMYIEITRVKDKPVPEDIRHVKGNVNFSEKFEDKAVLSKKVYEDILDYYEEKQNRELVQTELYAGEKETKGAGLRTEKPSMGSTAYNESENPRLDIWPARDPEGWTRIGSRPVKGHQYGRGMEESEYIARIEELQEDPYFRDLLYKRIDSGVENLDESMLMFFENHRFRDIVRRIKDHKLRNH